MAYLGEDSRKLRSPACSLAGIVLLSVKRVLVLAPPLRLRLRLLLLRLVLIVLLLYCPEVLHRISGQDRILQLRPGPLCLRLEITFLPLIARRLLFLLLLLSSLSPLAELGRGRPAQIHSLVLLDLIEALLGQAHGPVLLSLLHPLPPLCSDLLPLSGIAVNFKPVLGSLVLILPVRQHEGVLPLLLLLLPLPDLCWAEGALDRARVRSMYRLLDRCAHDLFDVRDLRQLGVGVKLAVQPLQGALDGVDAMKQMLFRLGVLGQATIVAQHRLLLFNRSLQGVVLLNLGLFILCRLLVCHQSPSLPPCRLFQLLLGSQVRRLCLRVVASKLDLPSLARLRLVGSDAIHRDALSDDVMQSFCQRLSALLAAALDPHVEDAAVERAPLHHLRLLLPSRRRPRCEFEGDDCHRRARAGIVD
mmetsp:Transcript_1823/g.3976  ORF Transcript_1823/g.3976 Transcript_1823/m.3976 type:complete len:417 (+) Transcript_1823:430-1680(+)